MRFFLYRWADGSCNIVPCEGRARADQWVDDEYADPAEAEVNEIDPLDGDPIELDLTINDDASFTIKLHQGALDEVIEHAYPAVATQLYLMADSEEGYQEPEHRSPAWRARILAAVEEERKRLDTPPADPVVVTAAEAWAERTTRAKRRGQSVNLFQGLGALPKPKGS